MCTQKRLPLGRALQASASSCCAVVAGVRLSGQDSERGTFNQRHAIMFDQHTGRRYALKQLASANALWALHDGLRHRLPGVGAR
jgi:2-oxoglutarate dehydrogenase E1 component